MAGATSAVWAARVQMFELWRGHYNCSHIQMVDHSDNSPPELQSIHFLNPLCPSQAVQGPCKIPPYLGCHAAQAGPADSWHVCLDCLTLRPVLDELKKLYRDWLKWWRFRVSVLLELLMYFRIRSLCC